MVVQKHGPVNGPALFEQVVDIPEYSRLTDPVESNYVHFVIASEQLSELVMEACVVLVLVDDEVWVTDVWPPVVAPPMQTSLVCTVGKLAGDAFAVG